MTTAPRIPKLCHHKATGQAVVRLNGKDHYCGPWGSERSSATYERLIARWLSAGRQLPQEADGAPLSVTQVIDLYWHRHVLTYYRRPDGSPSSEVGCIRVALRHLRRMFGDTVAAEFGPRRLMDLRDTMCGQVTRYGKPPARSSINGHFKRIKACFKWAVAHELVPPTVYEGLRSVDGLRAGRSAARETGRVRPIERSRLDAVLPLVSRQVAAILELMWLTGMRVGEVVVMRTGDIERGGLAWEYRPAHHKTAYRGRERTVPLGPLAQAVIQPFLQADPRAHLFSPQEAESERQAQRATASSTTRARRPGRTTLASRPPGVSYSTASIRRAIARACAETGVERWHPHQLRHTAATRFRKEAGLEAARVLLGHSSPVITDVHYAEVDRSKASALMVQLG